MGNECTTLKENKIAIIGMACKFPGADNVEDFWQNLSHKVESVGELPAERAYKIKSQLKAMGMDENPEYKKAGYLNNLFMFDNSFFGIINREAVAMSPAQRLFMEVGYHALEDAGYGGSALYGSKTGVFVGYISDLDSQDYQKMIGISKDHATPTGALSSNLCGRFSYFLNLTGPSMMVDTACSSSLTAINVACNSIKNGECNQALIGGVQIELYPYNMHKIGIESASGHLKPFDQMADGTCTGEGVAAILVKGYEDAIKDKDHIYAVIDAVGINQDGRGIGLSAPNPNAQKALIADTISKAGKTVDDITYIEAHGTGTALGDPIEMNVLANIFREKRTANEEKSCGIGSVKANVGHLYAVSGLAGIIKCCCMFQYKKIPATINFSQLNKKIKWKNSGLYINVGMIDWNGSKGKRCCGISNFGFSGTNCHIVLEEADEIHRAVNAQEYYPFVLSADSLQGLNHMIKKYMYYIQKNTEAEYKDVCFTASLGRKHGKIRLAINADSKNMLFEKLCDYKGITDIKKEIYVGSSFVGHGVELQELKEASERFCKIRQRESEKQRILSRHLCELYVSGVLPDWNAFFEGLDAVRVSLPLYEYEENEFNLVFEREDDGNGRYV